MYLVLALIMMASAITILFEREFTNGLKKLFSIPGMSLFLPLFVLSFLLIYNQTLVLWSINETQNVLLTLIKGFKEIFPFQKGSQIVAPVVFIALIALIPHFVVAFKKKRRMRMTFTYSWLVSLILWLILVFLLVS